MSKVKSNEFLIGYDIEQINALKNLLLAKGLTSDRFIKKNWQTFLNIEGTLLTCQLIENRYPRDDTHLYSLSYQGQQIAKSNYKQSPHETRTILHISDPIPNLPNDLIDYNYYTHKQVDLADKNLKTTFLQKHKELFTQAKGVTLIGLFRRTQLNPEWSLKEIIEHGMSSNNRTRQVCVEMGWLTREGNLALNAPDEIKTEFTKDSFIISMSG